MKNNSSRRQAVVALLNSDLVDRSFDVFANGYKDFLTLVNNQGDQPPLYPEPLIARAASAGVVSVFGNNVAADDLVVVLSFDLGTPATELRGNNINTALVGLFIEEVYTNFAQGRDHQVEVLPFRTLTPTGLSNDIARKIKVTPTGGVNTISQYVILPVLTSQNLGAQGTLAVGPDTIPAYTSNSAGKFAFMAPLPMRLSSTLDPETNGVFAAVVVVFKGMASYASDQLSIKVTPVFSHYQSRQVMYELIKTVVD